ncbi:CpaF family protein [Geoalkalibacter halelectricus]|uniref:CpaF family protein n=1 Tax=Geoalkalibacter halelectricus TaxID=2847045 RepID=A0ABY5ZM54_9BACT|nr:CpaF family protein [Geoalkalibacter halelectricus]MDO3378433.1 CpaF family protein [Geoalkalibacter halelectricus]UWZ80247.1 CpaF family protein [Geoalkalibacter halelectricus]
MALRELFARNKKAALADETATNVEDADSFGFFVPQVPERDETFYDLKHKIHNLLVDEINLPALESLSKEEIAPEINAMVQKLLVKEGVVFNEQEKNDLAEEILDELKGLGPLEPLLKDPTVSDILCNTYKDIFVERFGLLERTRLRFRDDNHLMNIIDRIVSRVGRRIDESSPMVDARLPDGSRVNAIIPPLALDGPMLSIRRFAVEPLKAEDLVRNRSLTSEIVKLLEGCVKAKLNILISGGTGAGKTTLLNVLSSFIPENERIITIEDSAELQLQQPHVVRLETRPASIEGTGMINQRDLVRNSLRMRPDRIVVGEVRGPEAFDMLQAMNTGHEGSLSTIHANSPRDSLTRMESMILTTGFNLPEQAMRFMISSALDIVVQISRFTDGTRRVKSITEVVGMEGQVVTLQDIFVFDKRGIDENGRVIGQFQATGIRPKFAEKLELAGIEVSEELFVVRD